MCPLEEGALFFWLLRIWVRADFEGGVWVQTMLGRSFEAVFERVESDAWPLGSDNLGVPARNF